MGNERAHVVSSFTIIKGSLITETYGVFRDWDLSISRQENLRRVRDHNTIGAKSIHWARDVAKVLNRRFDPAGRDKPLVDLAKASCDLEIWKPLLLWHMTRNEFLVRDFLIHWLYPHWLDGACHILAAEIVPYLNSLSKKPDILWSGEWSDATRSRVASGLLRIGADFDLLSGKVARSFASYRLPEASFIYLLHAMADVGMPPHGIIESDDWHMFLMNAADVERELFRLHQFKKIQYEVAGSLAQLKLPKCSSKDYVKEMLT
jgi:hypothetical protein